MIARRIVAVAIAVGIGACVTLSSEPVAGTTARPVLISDADDPGPDGSTPEEVLFTENTVTTENSDGSMTQEVFQNPENYRNSDDELVPISPDLEVQANQRFAAVSTGNDFTASLPADAAQDPVLFRANSSSVQMQLRGLDGQPVIDGASATYADVENAEEVVYEVTESGLKENIVLDDVPQRAPKFVYDLVVEPGIGAELTEAGSIVFNSVGGLTVATIPRGVMSDSASTPSSSDQVVYDLDQSGPLNYVLSVTPSHDWLLDQSRVYPVLIDPTITDEPATRDCWINETNPNAENCGANSNYVKVGMNTDMQRRRGLLAFDPGVPEIATVTSANLKIYLEPSTSVGTTSAPYTVLSPGKPFDAGVVSWNSAGSSGAWTGGNPTGTSSPSVTLSPTAGGWKTFDITSIVQGWASGTSANNGLLLKQVNEDVSSIVALMSSSTQNSSNLRPYLKIDYTMPEHAEYTTSVEIVEEELDANDNVLASTTTTSTATSGERTTAPLRGVCRRAVVKNYKHSTFGSNIYLFKISTKWCWNNSDDQIVVNTVHTGWDWIPDDFVISWQGIQKSKTHFYEWVNNKPISGYLHYKMGKVKHEYGAGPPFYSYPRNWLWVHSNGTYKWDTED